MKEDTNKRKERGREGRKGEGWREGNKINSWLEEFICWKSLLLKVNYRLSSVLIKVLGAF